MDKTQKMVRYDFVDALRGFAILGVMFLHVRNYMDLKGPLKVILGYGMYGVQLFYVVSSFSLYLSLKQREIKDGKRLFPYYFIRRFFRIAPLFYFCVLVYMLIYGTAPRGTAKDGVGLGAVLTTVSFVNGWVPSHINSIISGQWSVAIETNFYFLLPLFFLYIRGLRSAIIAMFGMVLAGILAKKAFLFGVALAGAGNPDRYSEFLYFWLPSQLGVFGAGIVLYYLFVRYFGDASKQKMTKWVAAALVIGGIAYFVFEMVSPFGFWKHFFVSFGFILIAMGLAGHPFKLLVNPLTCHIGRVSFSAYLLHTLVIEVVGHFMRDYPKNPSMYFVMMVPVLALSVGLSTLTYWWIELPGQSLGKWLIDRDKSRLAASASSKQVGEVTA